MKNTKRENYSESHKSEGKEYDLSFKKLRPRYFQWKMEKLLLKRELTNVDRSAQILDLATGTGRISNFLFQELNFYNVMGVDNSDSMLRIAQEIEPRIRYTQVDLRNCLDELGKFKFTVITGFRLFGKADKFLVKKISEAIDVCSEAGTILIINNHNNSRSITSKIIQLLKHDILPTRNESEILEELSKYKFKKIKRYSIGITPQSGRKYYLGKTISEVIEIINLFLFARMHSLGNNNVYVFQKVNAV